MSYTKNWLTHKKCRQYAGNVDSYMYVRNVVMQEMYSAALQFAHVVQLIRQLIQFLRLYM